MRKSKSMRMASGLLVVTMLSTCMISGTFARYTTQDNAKDTARVAKWGVTAVVSGDLFGADYVKGSGSATEGIISATYTGSVDSKKTADGAKIVAPGTNSDKGVTIKISGTPEVANEVKFESDAEDNKDIYLKKNTSGENYGTMVAVTGITDDNFAADTYYKLDASGKYVPATTAAEAAYELHDIVSLSDDYYPVVWTVTGAGEGDYTNVAAMVNALADFNATNKSLDEIDKNCIIKWKWAIDTNNDADTILGNIIAADPDAVPVKGSAGEYTTLTKDTDYNTTVAFNYKISVTQID